MAPQEPATVRVCALCMGSHHVSQHNWGNRRGGSQSLSATGLDVLLQSVWGLSGGCLGGADAARMQAAVLARRLAAPFSQIPVPGTAVYERSNIAVTCSVYRTTVALFYARVSCPCSKRCAQSAGKKHLVY